VKHRVSIVTACAVSAWALPCITASVSLRDTPALHADLILWVPDRAAIEPETIFRPIATGNGRSVFVDGSASVSFALTGDREALTTELVGHFVGTPWRERDRDYLNSQDPTSFKSGWHHVCGCIVLTDANGKPIRREPHYEWYGEWEDACGNVVQYRLSADGPQVRGYASLIPRHIVDAMPR
jgi:hypothetical protein